MDEDRVGMPVLSRMILEWMSCIALSPFTFVFLLSHFSLHVPVVYLFPLCIPDLLLTLGLHLCSALNVSSSETVI